ncbi:MAG: endonuclease [Chlorobi bacterium]|nr:endonuclease [Chlorobiota bacterium]
MKFSVIILTIIFFLGKTSVAQDLKPYEFPRGNMRLMFYNCENFFDTYDDTLKIDESFLPTGDHHWTLSKYYKKVYNISKVITAVGQWSLPEIVGLCEIENRKVLEDLTKKTDLKKFHYKIIHKESPDRRGIDVGFLYRPDKFFPINYEAIRVKFPFDANKPTRDILYVKGTNIYKDTLHIFINHWPSRWGGQAETDRKRKFAASVLRAKVDSLFKADNNPNIIIMGDLNDYPTNNSVVKVLRAKTSFDNIQNESLYNLAYYLQEVKGKGSLKHNGEWGVLDQIIVSGILLNKKNKIHTTPDNVHVFEAPFLLEPDNNYTGVKPFRTYLGFKFHDGYSDHLPVYIDLFETKK